MYTCLHPVHVYNRYLKDWIWSDCGHCEACRNKRAGVLSERINREFENNGNGSAFLVTLDYDNEHLPVYKLNELSGYYESNREDYSKSEDDIKFGRIHPSDITEYYRPVHHVDDCFGHLCYSDVRNYFNTIRCVFRRAVIKNSYEQDKFKFRYFVCGEYGPTTFRPHYHVIVWFGERFNRGEESFVQEIFCRYWKNGTCDFKPVITGGIASYLSGYVTGFSDLPAVLQYKPLRPFCHFSTSPVLGAYTLEREEIQTLFDQGFIKRYKFDTDMQEYVNDPFPRTVYDRYFPKCKGFSYIPFQAKLRVYANVFNYFRDAGRFPTLQEFNSLRLCDIPFPKRKLLDEKAIEDNGGEYLEWTYQDKYASMMCCKYCIEFGLTPEDVIKKFERIHGNLNYESLARFYQYQEEHFDDLQFTINHDRDFLPALPVYGEDLEVWQFNVLVSYGIDPDKLYPDGIRDDTYYDRLFWWNDPEFKTYEETAKLTASNGVKRKKDNDYKRNLKSNLIKCNYE